MLPLPVGRGDVAPAAPARPVVAAEASDPADAWLNEHPAGSSFDPAQAPATPTPPTPLDAEPAVAAEAPQPPAGEAPAAQAPSDTAPAAAAPSSAEPPAVTPSADVAPVSAASADAQPAAASTAPEPVRLSLEGKYLVADGTEPWTGAQVIQRLRDYAEAEPQIAEAKNFREFFGGDLEKTKAAWTPMIDALRAHPERIRFLEDALENMPPEKFQFLVDSAQHYDSQIPAEAAPAQPAASAPAQPEKYAQIDPETKQRLEKFERYQAEQEAKTQWNGALDEFPILRERADLRNSLIELFNAMYARDPNTRLEDALRINRPMYQAIVVATAGQEQPAAAPVVPALNGSPGASPAGTRQRVVSKPQTFTSTDDAVDEWLRTHPS